MNATHSRRWYRFSLRTAFILLTLVCLVVAWAAYQLNWIRERQEARKTFRTYSDANAPAPGILWIFGEKGEEIIILDAKLAASEVDRIKGLFPESEFLSVENAGWGFDGPSNLANP